MVVPVVKVVRVASAQVAVSVVQRVKLVQLDKVLVAMLEMVATLDSAQVLVPVAITSTAKVARVSAVQSSFAQAER